MDQFIGNADLIVIGIYLLVVFGIGIFLSGRGSRSTRDFFISGRSLPWWIIGTSMVATTFAADTPLVVSGLVARGGIFKNWLWWQWGIGGMVTVFLFAGLWRRAGITTDAELIELRYDGKPAAALRGYRSIWFGCFQNVLVIAWVMKAMAKIVMTVMGWESGTVIMGVDAQVFTVLTLFIIAVAYTVMSGLWGVVFTDLLQFILAMGGSVYLAVAAFIRIGGLEEIKTRLAASGFSPERILRIIPEPDALTGANPFTEFLILIMVVWWASYTIDGGGYLAQRLFAARDERHSVFGYLWYSIAHICLRPWPWIVVGLCGMAMMGPVDDLETYYPLMMREVLPPGIFGLALASFFAAFMSTIDTQLNWGSSLLVNDMYRRFIWKNRTDREYLQSARITVVVLAVLGAVASFAVDDISFAWKLIISVTAGIGSVYIGRWYWWRVNAWSEIAAMITALVCTFIFTVLSRNPRLGESALLDFPYSTALTVMISLPVWIMVTLLTRPVGEKKLSEFYRRVHPGGPGWKRFERIMPGLNRKGSGRGTFICIVSGMMLINSILIGLGKLIMGEFTPAVLLLGLSVVSGVVLRRWLRRGLAVLK